ncbi:MAG: ABC transporter ATP-binding protein/permease [Anaerolineae bacterium]|nr:ABC transporter ATP-binding protein/permease [Anaerolineae bacterium]
MHGGGWFIYMRGGADENVKPRVTRELLRRVLGYARPYRGRIVWMLVMILITTTLGLFTPLIFRDLIDNALPNSSVERLNVLALGLVAIPIISGGIRVMQRKVNAAIGEGVIYDLRVSLFEHLQRMSLRFFTNTKTGELMSRLNNDVVGAQRAISSTIVDIITNLVTVLATLAVMLALEWRLTVLGVLVLPFFILVARRLGGRLRDIARQQMEYNAQMNAMMNETLNISGALLVKLFGRIPNEVSRFDDRAAKVRDAGILQAVWGSQFFVLISMVSVIGTALVYWVGGHLVLDGVFTVGTIVAFGSYLTQLYGPLQALTNAPVDFATSMVSFERVFEVVDLPLEISDKPDALTLDTVRGELVFDDVSFKYEVKEENLLSDVERIGRMDNVRAVLSGGDGAMTGHTAQKPGAVHPPVSQAREDALHGVSFHIQPGQLAALVGPSGAGKTTMTYLIPRLYDPTEGRILLDGHDLRDVKLESLAAQIGMVTQETYLFHDTIRTNLLYARLDATQAELEAACKAANIHDFIVGLPDGYDTIVGERGYRLSGGEKQRLALARVILKDPRILVLDEATSHLDSQSEALIQDALKTVMQGRTSIVIAHRLSTILAADVILVMDRGRIVEQGTHNQLLEQGGLYADLYETQFSREREMV